MALTQKQQKDTVHDLVEADGTLSVSGLIKPDLLAAVAAGDAWVTANQASFISALPEPFKSTSTPAQKILLFHLIVTRRYGG